MSRKFIGSNTINSFMNKCLDVFPSKETNIDLQSTYDDIILNQEQIEAVVGFQCTVYENPARIALKLANRKSDGSYGWDPSYIGKEKDVVIKSSYTFNGKTYQTIINRSIACMFYHCNWIESIKFEDGIQIIGNPDLDTSNMFSGCTNLKRIYGLKNIMNRQASNISYMFYNCRSLEEIDISGIHWNSLTYVHHPFYYCKSLQKVTASYKDEWMLATGQTDTNSEYTPTDHIDISTMFSSDCPCQEITWLD